MQHHKILEVVRKIRRGVGGVEELDSLHRTRKTRQRWVQRYHMEAPRDSTEYMVLRRTTYMYLIWFLRAPFREIVPGWRTCTYLLT